MYFMSIYFSFTEGGRVFDVIYFVVFVLANEITYVWFNCSVKPKIALLAYKFVYINQ